MALLHKYMRIGDPFEICEVVCVGIVDKVK